jgi:DNA-binding NarL/FixJ family response regulator
VAVDDAEGVSQLGVLVVEDDGRVREALVKLLTASPPWVVTGQVRGADDAAQSAAKRPPAIALVDVLLPDLHTGLDLIRKLTIDLGVTVVAISADDGLRTAALTVGAVEFVGKGSSPEVIMAALASAAAQSGYVGEPTSEPRPQTQPSTSQLTP